MRLTKAERKQVHDKFGGRCAYCGVELPERWHADHMEPVRRGLAFESGRLVSSQTECQHPERHNIGNLMPACPPCNISKAQMDLETWRGWLAKHVESLNRHHSIYRLAKAYGLVQETGAGVVFYFERLAARRGEEE